MRTASSISTSRPTSLPVGECARIIVLPPQATGQGLAGRCAAAPGSHRDAAALPPPRAPVPIRIARAARSRVKPARAHHTKCNAGMALWCPPSAHHWQCSLGAPRPPRPRSSLCQPAGHRAGQQPATRCDVNGPACRKRAFRSPRSRPVRGPAPRPAAPRPEKRSYPSFLELSLRSPAPA